MHRVEMIEHRNNQTVPHPVLDDILDQETSNLKLFVLDMDLIDMRLKRTEPDSPLASSRLKHMRLSDPIAELVALSSTLASTRSSSSSSSWSILSNESPRPPSSLIENDLMPSTCFDDYFEVQTQLNAKQLESYGLHNSLFLAVARSLLYKIYFVDRKYKYLIKAAYANCMDELDVEFKFDSDMKLQEILRKSLCVYWLGFVHNGEFVNECKYSR